MSDQGSVEIRCMCSRAPLLALAGQSKNGEPFVHLKVHKQRKLYGEMIATQGVVHLRCRECFRWTKVTIRRTVETSRPSDVALVSMEQVQ